MVRLSAAGSGCAAGPTDVPVMAVTWETIGAAPFGKDLDTGLEEGVDWSSPGKVAVVFGANAAASGGAIIGDSSGANLVSTVFDKVVGAKATSALAFARGASGELRKPAGIAAPGLASALRCAPGNLEPSMMILIGGVVCVFVMGVLLPILGVSSSVQEQM